MKILSIRCYNHKKMSEKVLAITFSLFKKTL